MKRLKSILERRKRLVWYCYVFLPIIIILEAFVLSHNTNSTTILCDLINKFAIAFIDIVFTALVFKKYTVHKKTLFFILICTATTLIFIMINPRQSLIIAEISLIALWLTISVFYSQKTQKTTIRKFLKPKKQHIKKVTAIVPNYNYANYLDERINSILRQNYKVHELIILDDKSTDNSAEIIEKIIKKITRQHPEIAVKYIQNKINSGNVFKQWAKAFEVANGDYIWICEADDSCSKYFLNAVMGGFNDDGVILSYAESLTIDEKSKIIMTDLREWIDIFKTKHWNNNYTINGREELKKYSCVNNTIANVSSVVFRRDPKVPYKKYLKGAQNFRLAGDWYFYSKIMLHGKVSYCAESLNYHRMHNKGVTLNMENWKHYKEILDVQKSIAKDVNLPRRSKNRIEIRDREWAKANRVSKDEIEYDKISLKKLTDNQPEKVLLSILIPVYNNEKYLKTCLASVFCNQLEKTEIIIVNDGSSDNSEKIIKEYIKNHPEIVYIKHNNIGLAAVKNEGLKLARGKYIIFLDSDDYVSSNMYDTMLKKAIKENCDIVHCDIDVIYPDNSHVVNEVENGNLKKQMEKIFDCGVMASSCNKMVKKDLYKGLEFPEELHNEDVAVTPIILARAKKIGYIPSPFYKYVQHHDSMNNALSEKRLDILDAVKACIEEAKKENLSDIDIIEYSLFKHQIVALLVNVIFKIEDEEIKEKMLKKFYKKYKMIGFSEYNKKYAENLDVDIIRKKIKEERL